MGAETDPPEVSAPAGKWKPPIFRIRLTQLDRYRGSSRERRVIHDIWNRSEGKLIKWQRQNALLESQMDQRTRRLGREAEYLSVVS
jgi:hypothetical protein